MPHPRMKGRIPAKFEADLFRLNPYLHIKYNDATRVYEIYDAKHVVFRMRHLSYDIIERLAEDRKYKITQQFVDTLGRELHGPHVSVEERRRQIQLKDQSNEKLMKDHLSTHHY